MPHKDPIKRAEYRREYFKRPEVRQRMAELAKREEAKQKRREYLREYIKRPEQREKRAARQREYFKQERARQLRREWNHEYFKRRPEMLERQREANREPRRIVLEKYGNKCTCCGETKSAFLQLDHVNNDGAVERRRLGTGRSIYRQAIKENFPSRFQLLCANCNFGKLMNGGVCPHKTES